MQEPVRTPDWVKDAVFYQIFPDRFARSSRAGKPAGLEPWDTAVTRHGYKGGDLYGVIEKLPYLKSLGVTALYFNPIFQSAANHRYHTQDYYQIDPILGGNEAFDELVAAAREHTMRIVLDGVFNHASRGFYQFQQTLENGSGSPYIDWFHFDRATLGPGVGPNAYPEPQQGRDATAGSAKTAPGGGVPIRDRASLERYGYRAWWDIPALPKFNTDFPEVREFLLDVGAYWIERGADGWRLDVPGEIDDDAFWREFRRRVKEANPEAYIVGEIWADADRWLSGDQFDAVMNYVFNRLCYRFFGADCISTEFGRPGEQELVPVDAPQLADELVSLLDRYPREITQAQLNLLSSHDEPRFVTVVSGQQPVFRLATAFQMTLPGAPCIYYGDEIGMDGGYDPDCRRTFPEDPDAYDHETLEWTRVLTGLRARYEALRRGALRVALAEERVFGFVRTLGNEWILVVFNAGRTAWSGSVDVATVLRTSPAGAASGRAPAPHLEKDPPPDRVTCVFSSGAGATLPSGDPPEVRVRDGIIGPIELPEQSVQIYSGSA